MKDEVSEIISRLSRLPNVQTALQSRLDWVKKNSAEMLLEGWSASDIIKYTMMTEEFSPELDEDLSLKMMDDLFKKYKK